VIQVSHIRTEGNETTCVETVLFPFLSLWNMYVAGGLYSSSHYPKKRRRHGTTTRTRT